jgi:hypothetical protein
MKHRLLAVSLLLIFFFPMLSLKTIAQEKREGQVNWVEGYISAIGEGTAAPSGNKAKDQLRATRAATILAQRALLETIKGFKVDAETKVGDRLLKDDVIRSSVGGMVAGAEIVKQDVRWEGETPIATVELRICLGGLGGCKSEKSFISALDLDQKSEQSNAPSQRLNDIAAKPETTVQKVQDVIYDSSRPVTGMILNLQGLVFERVILPVVITTGDENKPFTVYSVKSVDPQIIRTYGVVRYTGSVEQARKNPYLGDNVIVVPVSSITKDNMIMIVFDVARLIRETTSHGNDYLKSAKVIIADK